MVLLKFKNKDALFQFLQNSGLKKGTNKYFFVKKLKSKK